MTAQEWGFDRGGAESEVNMDTVHHQKAKQFRESNGMQAKVTLNGTLWQIKGRPDGLSGVSEEESEPGYSCERPHFTTELQL